MFNSKYDYCVKGDVLAGEEKGGYKAISASRNFLSGFQANVPRSVIVNFVGVNIYDLGLAPGALCELTHLIPIIATWRKFHYHPQIMDEVTKANRDIENFFQGKTASL